MRWRQIGAETRLSFSSVFFPVTFKDSKQNNYSDSLRQTLCLVSLVVTFVETSVVSYKMADFTAGSARRRLMILLLSCWSDSVSFILSDGTTSSCLCLFSSAPLSYFLDFSVFSSSSSCLLSVFTSIIQDGVCLIIIPFNHIFLIIISFLSRAETLVFFLLEPRPVQMRLLFFLLKRNLQVY